MAPHSSTLAWKTPWMEEPGRLQSMGLLRVGHNGVTSFSLFTFMHWRRKWQPTPVFLPGESQGQGSQVGCRLWGRTESDTTEATQQQQQQDISSYISESFHLKSQVSTYSSIKWVIIFQSCLSDLSCWSSHSMFVLTITSLIIFFFFLYFCLEVYSSEFELNLMVL